MVPLGVVHDRRTGEQPRDEYLNLNDGSARNHERWPEVIETYVGRRLEEGDHLPENALADLDWRRRGGWKEKTVLRAAPACSGCTSCGVFVQPNALRYARVREGFVAGKQDVDLLRCHPRRKTLAVEEWVFAIPGYKPALFAKTLRALPLPAAQRPCSCCFESRKGFPKFEMSAGISIICTCGQPRKRVEIQGMYIDRRPLPPVKRRKIHSL